MRVYSPDLRVRLETGLGEALTARGLAVSGRETVGDFASLSFQEQIDLVAYALSTAMAMIDIEQSVLRSTLR
jgi:hypothetical protein